MNGRRPVPLSLMFLLFVLLAPSVILCHEGGHYITARIVSLMPILHFDNVTYSAGGTPHQEAAFLAGGPLVNLGFVLVGLWTLRKTFSILAFWSVLLPLGKYPICFFAQVWQHAHDLRHSCDESELARYLSWLISRSVWHLSPRIAQHRLPSIVFTGALAITATWMIGRTLRRIDRSDVLEILISGVGLLAGGSIWWGFRGPYLLPY